MFQANAVQVNAFQIGAVAVTPTPTPDETRGKGGWDPYYYRRRNKRRDDIDDVREFLQTILGQDLEEAPAEVVEQAEEAKQAATEVLAIVQTGIDAEARWKLSEALDEINEFYRLVRDQVRMAREREDEEDEDDFLLLS